MAEQNAVCDHTCLAEELMTDLLGNRRFQLYWTELVLQQLRKENKADCTLASTDVIFREQKAPNISSSGVIVEEMTKILEQLWSSIEFTTKIYLTTAYSGLPEAFNTPQINREASAIYEVRVRLDRLCEQKQLHVNQFKLVVRRVIQMLKNLAKVFYTMYSIPSCALFSLNLADLLYRVEEYCFSHLSEESHRCTTPNRSEPSTLSNELQRMSRAINRFYVHLAKALNVRSQCNLSPIGTTHHSLSPQSSDIARLRRSHSTTALTQQKPWITFVNTSARKETAQDSSFLLSGPLRVMRSSLPRITNRSISLKDRSINYHTVRRHASTGGRQRRFTFTVED